MSEWCGTKVPVKIPRHIEYKPKPVKDTLSTMKNLSSLMIDLAYYSIVYNDKRLAFEVLRLEDYIDELWVLLAMQASLAARDAEDAESMLSILKLASSTNKLSDAAADIAILPIIGIKPHIAIRAAILYSDEVVSKIEIKNGSRVANKSIEVLFSELGIALDIIALRRRHRWYISPDPDFKLKKGDILIVRGSKETVKVLREYVKDKVPLEEDLKPAPMDTRFALELANLKNLSELMIDLAYLSVLTNDKDAAMEVLELEEYMDSKHLEVAEDIIESFRNTSANEIIGLLRVIEGFETISDAAAEIAGIVISDIPPHPILREIEKEAEERVLKVPILKDMIGKTLSELSLDRVGANILAIKRRGKWIVDPSPECKLEKGDILILKCYEEGLEQLIKILKLSTEKM